MYDPLAKQALSTIIEEEIPESVAWGGPHEYALCQSLLYSTAEGAYKTHTKLTQQWACYDCITYQLLRQ